MNKAVNAIELTFENLDWIKIPAKHFGAFSMRGIYTTVNRVACNVILQRLHCDYVEFELLRSVEEAYLTLQEDVFYDPIAGPGFLDRIAKRKDLTHLTLHYADGSDEQFTLPWVAEDDTSYNKLQKILQHDTQSLFVAIGIE